MGFLGYIHANQLVVTEFAFPIDRNYGTHLRSLAVSTIVISNGIWFLFYPWRPALDGIPNNPPTYKFSFPQDTVSCVLSAPSVKGTSE